MPPITKVLLILNVAVHLLQPTFGEALVANFALWPIGQFPAPGGTVGFHFWQLITYGFLHGSLMHLGLNMYALYMFGGEVERTLGPRYFLALYFVTMLTAALTQLAVVTWTGGPEVYPTVGASGAVFGVLLAFGMLFPTRTLVLLFPPIPMPAIVFVILYGLIELVSGVLGTTAGVAHFAHLGGMVGGLPILLYWKSRHRYFTSG